MYIRRKKKIMDAMMMGVMCLRNQKAILRFFAPLRRSLLLSRKVALCA